MYCLGKCQIKRIQYIYWLQICTMVKRNSMITLLGSQVRQYHELVDI